MTEALYATIGRKQEELDNLNVEYDRLLSVLSGVVYGDIDVNLVAVDLKARSWSIDKIDDKASEVAKESDSENDQELV
ncbi:MAG: hypothetical protein WC856_07735 [Methylococcaceae bacterium]|jgi:hypothetical protein